MVAARLSVKQTPAAQPGTQTLSNCYSQIIPAELSPVKRARRTGCS